MKLQEVLDRTVRFFKEKQLDSPRLDAELLIARALGFRRIDLYLKFDQPLGEPELIKCREMVRRRSQGEPVAYILGEKDFFGLGFRVDSRVLVPRPETELLAEAALEFADRAGLESPRILDLGSGSGCLGLTLAKKIENARLISVDLSEDALNVARSNADHLGVADRCEWIHGDASRVALAAEGFDLIVANPPYIAPGDPRLQDSVARFEPSMALYAEQEGFAAIEGWAPGAVRALKPGGWIGFEFGAGQGPRAQALFESLGLQEVRLIPDLAGHPRHVTGLKGNRNG